LVKANNDLSSAQHPTHVPNQDGYAYNKNIMFVKIDGKGNIRRYREFFSAFKIPIHVITDLDALVRGFEQLTQDSEILVAHSRLMGEIDKTTSPRNEPNSKTVRSIVARRTTRELWSTAQFQLSECRESPSQDTVRPLEETLTELFEAGNGDARLNELMNPSNEKISSARDTVISSLSEENVY